MQTYRINRFDGAGRMIAGMSVACPGDAAALAYAKRITGPQQWAEAWRGTIFVGRLAPAAPACVASPVGAAFQLYANRLCSPFCADGGGGQPAGSVVQFARGAARRRGAAL